MMEAQDPFDNFAIEVNFPLIQDRIVLDRRIYILWLLINKNVINLVLPVWVSN